MIRTVVLIPLAIIFTAACGLAICRALRWQPHLDSLRAAAVAIFLASEMALVPVMLARRSSQLVMSQAALVGSMIHLFVAAALAAFVILVGLPLGQSFVYWLLAFYWVTLIMLVAGFIRAIRTVPPAGVAAPKP